MYLVTSDYYNIDGTCGVLYTVVSVLQQVLLDNSLEKWKLGQGRRAKSDPNPLAEYRQHQETHLKTSIGPN